MPILFTCPHCGSRTNVDDRYVGQTGPCFHCGRTITVPGPAQASEVASEPPLPSASTGGCLLAGAVAGVLLLIVLFSGTFLVKWPEMPSHPRLTTCSNNLNKIYQALLDYQKVHGSLPPAYTVDDDGRPLHSWRVLLLPHLGEEALYRQIRLDEPWNSSHNLVAANRMPKVYQCPEHPFLACDETSYVVVVGAHTMFPFSQGRCLPNVKDALERTILLVEQRSGVKWMEPTDLDFDTMSFAINNAKESSLGSFHPGNANVLFCDGTVKALSNRLSPVIVQQLLEVDDGEPEKFWEMELPRTSPKPEPGKPDRKKRLALSRSCSPPSQPLLL